MASEHWRKLEGLFGQAVEMTGEERRQFLDTACGDDPELRKQLEELLAEDTELNSSLGTSVFSVHDLLTETQIPEEVGPYRLLERLGAGGMGVVYRAERQDGEFEQIVAIKFLRRGLFAEAARRFKIERQILADLDHPHIARLLDGGTTPEGVPYVVMEWVDGDPVDRWCEHRDLSVQERLELFLGICEAVSAAHRSLVVHCDLKPSNLLVDQDSTPKLLDFGIARLLDTNAESDEGRAKHRLLTPSYASPEQLSGEAITVATDVYLLGLVLYKLLSGRLPHQLEGLTQEEASRILSEQEPQPIRSLPSRPKSLPVDSELDAIVLKALEFSPEDRFASVEQFVEDLRRYLEGLPVLAYDGSWLYRTGKFLRRQWIPVGALAAVLGMILTFGVYWQDQAGALEKALRRSQVIERLLREMVWSVDPAYAGTWDISVSKWLEAGIRRLDLVQGEPEIEASLRALFGRILISVDQQEQALQQLEKAHRLFREEIRTPGRTLQLAEVRTLSDLAVASFLASDSDASKAEAQTMGQEAVDLARETMMDQPEELLGILTNLSLIYCWQSKFAEARPLAEEMMQLVRRSDGLSVMTAKALEQQALIKKNVDQDLEGSKELYLEALEIVKRLEGEYHPETALIYNQLGVVAHLQKKLKEAVGYQEKGLAVRQTLFEPGHREIAMGFYNLASAYQSLEDWNLAEDRMMESLRIHQKSGPDKARTGQVVTELAAIMLARGASGAEVEALIRNEITPIWWNERAETSRLLAWARALLARSLALQGRDTEARHLYEQATRVFTANPDKFEAKAAQTEEWFAELGSWVGEAAARIDG